MYLTSQRVSILGMEATGINTFLYRHPEQTLGIDWNTPDLARVVDELPGTLTARKIEVPPGGNAVRSYLDIVATDSTSADVVERALQKFVRELTPARLSHVVHISGVAIRLGVELKREHRVAEEFRELSERALQLLRSPSPPEWRAQEPLRALVTMSEDSRTYELDAPSAARLRSIHVPNWIPPRVVIAHATQSDLRSMWGGDVCQHIAPVLTGLALDALAPLGGIQFVDSGSGELVWEWPVRSGADGYCLNCHQLRTLVQHGLGYQCSFCGNQQDTNGLWVATLS